MLAQIGRAGKDLEGAAAVVGFFVRVESEGIAQLEVRKPGSAENDGSPGNERMGDDSRSDT